MKSVNLSLKQLANKERVELELRKNKITMQVLSHPQIQLLEQVCTEIPKIPKFPTALDHVTGELPKLFKDELNSDSDSDSDSEEEMSDNDRVDILVRKYIELGLIALGAKKILVKKPLSEYQKYQQMRRPEIMKEKPGLKNTEYMGLVAEEWQALRKKDAEKSSPKSPLSEYQKFQEVRIPKIMKENPGLKNTEYMGLVAEEWQDLKLKNLRSMQKKAENNKKVADEEWSLKKIKENLTEVTFEEFIKNKAYEPDKNQSYEENKKYVRLVYDRKWTMLTDKINPEFVMKPIAEPLVEVVKSSTPIDNRPDCSMESLRTDGKIDKRDTVSVVHDLVDDMKSNKISKIEIKEDSIVVEFTNTYYDKDDQMKSDMVTNTSPSKELLKRHIEIWLGYDDKIRELNLLSKEHTDNKKKKEKEILEMIEKLNLGGIRLDVTDDYKNIIARVYKHTSITKSEITEDLLKDVLMESYQNEKKSDQIIKKINSKRQLNERCYLERI